jgi:dihydrofolate reductase
MTSRLVVSTFVSLDGVMQGPGGPGEDGSNGFRHGGWLAPHVDEGFGRIMDGVLGHADGLLLGRRSYEILAAYWPYSEEPGADKLNGMPKYVATRAPMDPKWRNTEVLVGEAAQTVADLKRRTDGQLLVQGSSDPHPHAPGGRAGRRVPAAGVPGRPRPGQAAVSPRGPPGRAEAHRVDHHRHRRRLPGLLGGQALVRLGRLGCSGHAAAADQAAGPDCGGRAVRPGPGPSDQPTSSKVLGATVSPGRSEHVGEGGVLVLGGTGKTGRLVAARLEDRGAGADRHCDAPLAVPAWVVQVGAGRRVAPIVTGRPRRSG